MVSRIFIINVGVNASHGNLRSPVYRDGKFEFVPIPEPIKSKRGCPNCLFLPRYRDLFKEKLQYVPPKCYDLRVHNDPEFETFTYGDYPTIIPRASNLRRIEKDDYLFFLARMVKWENGKFSNKAGFYVIGFFEIEKVIKEITSEPSATLLKEIRENAHMKRAMWNPEWYDRFWIFKGSKRSERFEHVVPFTRGFVDRVLLDRECNKLMWGRKRSELQVIGSHTRACRIIQDKERVKEFFSKIRRHT